MQNLERVEKSVERIRGLLAAPPSGTALRDSWPEACGGKGMLKPWQPPGPTQRPCCKPFHVDYVPHRLGGIVELFRHRRAHSSGTLAVPSVSNHSTRRMNECL